MLGLFVTSFNAEGLVQINVNIHDYTHNNIILPLITESEAKKWHRWHRTWSVLFAFSPIYDKSSLWQKQLHLRKHKGITDDVN